MGKGEKINQEDFITAFLVALEDKRVVEKLQSAMIEKLTGEVEHLKGLVTRRDEKIKELEEKTECSIIRNDDLEQYSRRNSLRISGVTQSQDEDVEKEILTMFNTKMQVTPPITTADIDRAHRTGTVTEKSGPRAIIVKFATYRARQRVYASRSMLGPPDKRRKPGDPWNRKQNEGATTERPPYAQAIWVNEDLTLQRSALLYKARQKKKPHKINDCWTHDGRIMIKNTYGKIMQIKTEKDLDN